MLRIVKRVPLDFDYPIRIVWAGYGPSLDEFKNNEELVKRVPKLLEYKGNVCSECDKHFGDCDESSSHCIWYNE